MYQRMFKIYIKEEYESLVSHQLGKEYCQGKGLGLNFNSNALGRPFRFDLLYCMVRCERNPGRSALLSIWLTSLRHKTIQCNIIQFQPCLKGLITWEGALPYKFTVLIKY